MTHKEILQKVDHTLLAQTATWKEIQQVCDDALFYNTASVCIPPCYVKRAKEYVGNKMKICTVIGFPNGSNTTDTKVYEARNALENAVYVRRNMRKMQTATTGIATANTRESAPPL